MIAVAGTVVAVIFYLDDKKLNIFLNSFIGALVATLCELIIGTISLDVFGERLWNYGILSYRGIISPDALPPGTPTGRLPPVLPAPP